MSNMDLPNYWLKFVQDLGLQGLNESGTRARCPDCRCGWLVFYNDVIGGGKRFCCERCRKSGDMLELICTVKRVKPELALEFLTRISPEAAAHWQTCTRVRELHAERVRQIEHVFTAGRTLGQSCNSASLNHFVYNQKLTYNHFISWHESHLHKQFRWITKTQFAEAAKRLSLPDSLRWPPKAKGALLSKLYRLPGQISGLVLHYLGPQNRLQQQVFLADQETGDPGYGMQSLTAHMSSPVILTSDASWWLMMTMEHAQMVDGPNPVALVFDGEHRTRAPQLVLNRQVTFWHHELTPKLLTAGIRLNAKLTTMGSDGYGFRSRAIRALEPAKLAQTVWDKAMTWREALTKYSQQAKPQELQQLIRDASLSEQELQQVGEVLGESILPYLEGGTYEGCPPETLTHHLGVVEQTPSGWTLTRNGERQQATLMSWRIARNYREGDKKLTEVELFHDGKWHSTSVPQSKLALRCYETLVEASIELDLPPFSAIESVRKDLYMIGHGLNPPPPPKRPKTVGWDFNQAVLRTSKLEIPLLRGAIESFDNPAEGELLALADQSRPSPQIVREIANHVPSRRILDALVTQMLHTAAGLKPLAVLCNRSYGALAYDMFKSLDILGDTPLGLSTDCLGRVPKTKASRKRLVDDVPLWGSCNTYVAHWAAGIRPVILLEGPCNPRSKIQDQHLQRMLIQLFARAAQLRLHTATLTTALQKAWETLGAKAGLDIRQPIDQSQAIGFWVSQGILNGQMLLLRRNPTPGKISESAAWPARTDGQLWFARAALNQLLEDHGLTPWDFSEIAGDAQRNQVDYDQQLFHKVVAWKISSSLLSEAARVALLQPRMKRRKDSAAEQAKKVAS